MDGPLTFTLHLRVPGWCEQYRLEVNGTAQHSKSADKGYVAITREWQPGDTISYVMEMPIRATWAHPAVRQLQGRVAIQRGPVVYCLEGIDHGDIRLDRIAVDPARVAGEFCIDYRPDFMGGSAVIHGQGQVIEDTDWEGILYRSTSAKRNEIKITAVPYCVWGNREQDEMRVWLRAVG
jgi:DUF1680 family protein